VAFDTNILVYASGIRRFDTDEPKIRVAELLLADSLSSDFVVMPVQACLELHNVLVRRGRLDRAAAESVVDEFAEGASLVDTDLELMQLGFALAEAHRLQTFDAIILAAAAAAACEILYSEDMQNGFEWNGVCIVNPFA